VRDRAALAMQMHAYRQAIELFERYLALMPLSDDHGRVREQIAYLRAWLDQN
jgi:regulator of sirC expression with transglutaminase-like and TPR domain